MDLRLSGIRALGEDRYEVTFDGDGGVKERFLCRVVTHKGITAMAVEDERDLFMSDKPARADSREVAKAVIAYHRRRLEGS